MHLTINRVVHTAKRILRHVPFAAAAKRMIMGARNERFATSADYWTGRYRQGGNSGEGSYGRLASYKAKFLNDFVSENAVKSVFELGCGDGNQLSKLEFEHYVGVDISDDCLRSCRKISQGKAWDFCTPDDFDKRYPPESFDLGLSLDVIYHLVEDAVFIDYLDRLFSRSRRHALVYSSDMSLYDPNIPHVRHREFTKTVAERFPEWRLRQVFENPLKKDPYSQQYGSFAMFHLFERR
jgi:SAM-dependent methyltransferase